LVGKVAIWRNEIPKALYNSNILKISFKKFVSNEFMNYLFNSKSILNVLKLISKGTTNVSAIYYKDLSKMQIWIMPLIEQQQIVSYIEQETTKLKKVIDTIEKEITLVQEYKTVLIAEAVTGKIDVRDFVIPEIIEEETYEDLEEELDMVAEDGEEIEME
jgi:type I restriction enzyme S subunit